MEWQVDRTGMGDDGGSSSERYVTVGWQDVGMITDEGGGQWPSFECLHHYGYGCYLD